MLAHLLQIETNNLNRLNWLGILFSFYCASKTTSFDKWVGTFLLTQRTSLKKKLARTLFLLKELAVLRFIFIVETSRFLFCLCSIFFLHVLQLWYNMSRTWSKWRQQTINRRGHKSTDRRQATSQNNMLAYVKHFLWED